VFIVFALWSCNKGVFLCVLLFEFFFLVLCASVLFPVKMYWNYVLCISPCYDFLALPPSVLSTDMLVFIFDEIY